LLTICLEGEQMKLRDRILRQGVLAVLFLLPVQAAYAAKVTPAPDMPAAQARQAVMAAAARFQVSVNPNLRQRIMAKSVRISQTRIVFDGAPPDQYNGGAHRYTIDFTGFTSASMDCSRVNCIVSSDPQGTLARNETGSPMREFTFIDEVVGTVHITSCSAPCRTLARNFATALNSLRALALSNPEAARDFHQLAAAWRALDPKPPLPNDVRVQRLLAEDAVKAHQPEEALKFYEDGLALYPTWPQGCFNAALIAAELGFFADAVEYMEHYLELLPEAPDAQAARDQIDIWRYKANNGAATNNN
jgi:hypothetical protein